jgi:hypothetical protein
LVRQSIERAATQQRTHDRETASWPSGCSGKSVGSLRVTELRATRSRARRRVTLLGATRGGGVYADRSKSRFSLKPDRFFDNALDVMLWEIDTSGRHDRHFGAGTLVEAGDESPEP